MEEDNKIKKIIRLYFGKHFSLNSRILFGRWLRAENGEAEKNSMLQKLWEESSAEVTVSTYEDWNTLQKRLRTKLSDTSRFSFRYQWIKYAAIFVLIAEYEGMRTQGAAGWMSFAFVMLSAYFGFILLLARLMVWGYFKFIV